MAGQDVRRLIRRARSAALATAMADSAGRPYASLVTVACDGGGQPLLLLSSLSDHARNLSADPRASLLIDEARGLANPQTGARVSLVGEIRRTDDPSHAARFLARHPAARRYAGFGDFGFFGMVVERGHFVGGFARAHWLERSDLALEGDAVAALAAAEAEILAHMNDDHAGTIDLYAQALLGRRGDGWRMIAVDVEGLDLYRRGIFVRLEFPTQVTGVDDLRETLVALAADARSRSAA